MYVHARKKAKEINLSEAELFETGSFIFVNLFNSSLGLIGILFVLLAPQGYKSSSGYIYMVIPLLYSILFAVRGREARKRFGDVIEQSS